MCGEDEIVKKRKVRKGKRNYFKPDDISENDERDRCTSLSQRDYIIKSCGLLQSIYVNFHRSQLLTESDKRKYKELFAKLISANEVTSLPVLSGIQTKSKVIKGPTAINQYNINMPTNLNPPLANETLTLTNIQSDTDETGVIQVTGSVQANTSSEVQLTLRTLPSLTQRNNKTTVTNVIKRHNGQQVSDKII